MQVQLLPSTITGDRVSRRQHYSCFVIDDRVAVDAGCLASSVSEHQRSSIRNVVLTHAHLDHIAGLPLFIDDLFDSLEKPVTIWATEEVIDVVENDVFNWRVYPRFSELENKLGPVMRYERIVPGVPFEVEGLNFEAITVNHKVPAVGYLISDGGSSIAITGDTAEMNGFWSRVNSEEKLGALLIECAFPDRLKELAEVSHHLTPSGLKTELEKFRIPSDVFAINLKPMYRDETAGELASLGLHWLSVLEVGERYSF